MEILPFDYRRVFSVMNGHSVAFLLVGGLNYFFLHKPVTTQDIDLLIEDTPQNRSRCERALTELNGDWGRNDDDWGPVCAKQDGWLSNQGVFCLLTHCGPVDIFLSIPGIPNYHEAFLRSVELELDLTTSVRLISARDLLACQLAIPEVNRKSERVAFLRGILEHE